MDHDGLAGDVEVLRALMRRRDTGRWDDGHRIAAVVGGGGMRGAYTGGMAHALHDAGLEPFFDVVYGSSAGVACRAFADPRRLGTRRPVVSLDHLLDEIMVTAKPLPWERLRDSAVPLRVVATAVDDLTPHVLEPSTVTEWRAALRATATIPYLAGPAVELHGRRWIDGVGHRAAAAGARRRRYPRARPAQPHRVRAAAARPLGRPGAVDARARPRQAGARRDRPAQPSAGPGAAGAGRPCARGHAIAQRSHRLAPVLQVLADPAHAARAGRHVLAVAPAEDAGVRGLTTDRARVERAARPGYAAMAARIAATLDAAAA